jgi:hypothetical protein
VGRLWVTRLYCFARLAGTGHPDHSVVQDWCRGLVTAEEARLSVNGTCARALAWMPPWCPMWRTNLNDEHLSALLGGLNDACRRRLEMMSPSMGAI